MRRWWLLLVLVALICVASSCRPLTAPSDSFGPTLDTPSDSLLPYQVHDFWVTMKK
jgi:hypothetical protein